MMIELNMEITIKNKRMCESIIKAVEPDNVTAPSTITIDMICQNESMKIVIKSSDTKILTFRNTVDDLLEHISIAMKTISEMK